MKVFLIFVTAIFNFNALPHDLPLAFLTLWQEGDEVKLQIKIEADDLELVLGQKSVALNDLSIKDYISANLDFVFDGKSSHIDIYEVTKNRQHFMINANVLIDDFCQSIEVTNTLLVQIPNHSNILQLRLGEKERDFRMHKKRQDVEIVI